MVKEHVTSFFKHQYSIEGVAQGGIPSADDSVCNLLTGEVSFKEVKATLSDIAPLKARGIGGLNV